MQKSSAALKNDQAFEAGVQAFKAGEGRNNNPNERYSPGSVMWDQGWTYGQRGEPVEQVK